MEEIAFHWADYLVFAVSLAIGLLVGVVFLFKGRGQKEGTDDYLLGGRDMGPVTVGASMLASTLNAVFLLGGVAEVYYRYDAALE
jgi:Na+/proline symporter